MILRTSRGADYQARDMFSDASRVPGPGMPRYGSGGGFDADAIESVPAAGAAIRLLAETGGLLPMNVYQGRRGDPGVTPAPDTWEAAVLAEPSIDQSPFDTWSFTIASLQRGGALLLKAKDNRGRVAELNVLDPRRTRTKIENGAVVFYVRDGSKTKRLTRADVIYIPGYLCRSPQIGSSVTANYAATIGATLQLEQFQDRYFRNDASPGGIITVPGNPKKSVRDEMRESWEARHQGNPGAVGILWGGAEYGEVGISLADAQFIEAQGWGVEQIARMYRVPKKMLTGEADESDPEVENLRFATYSLQPWTARIEQALSLDRDLFPNPSRHAVMNLEPLLRANFSVRATSYREARQGGWMTANEIRRREGMADHPDGGELQVTPVGGAPNAHVKMVDDT